MVPRSRFQIWLSFQLLLVASICLPSAWQKSLPGAWQKRPFLGREVCPASKTCINGVDLLADHVDEENNVQRVSPSKWTYASTLDFFFDGVPPFSAKGPIFANTSTPPTLFPWSLSTKSIDFVFSQFSGTPNVFLEIGTHWGFSAVQVAKKIQRDRIDSFVLCVDTWLGDTPAWMDPLFRLGYAKRNGMTNMFEEFRGNIYGHSVQSNVVPLRLPSLIAARVLSRVGFKADIIYVDASHDFFDVYADLIAYDNIVSPGGIMFGDDYQILSVKKAVDRFVKERGLSLFVFDGNIYKKTVQKHWMVRAK